MNGSTSPHEPGTPYPICTVCPGCGCPQHRKVRPDRFVAFGNDRVCLACRTRYTPPTPVWGGIALIVVGSLITVPCLLSIMFGLAQGNPAPIPCNGLFAALGILAIIQGFRSFAQNVVPAPVWNQESGVRSQGSASDNQRPTPDSEP
jgi:hypothetical protein